MTLPSTFEKLQLPPNQLWASLNLDAPCHSAESLRPLYQSNLQSHREAPTGQSWDPSLWNHVGPCGASGAWRPFCLPFLVGKTQASMTFPEFQRADSTVANQERSRLLKPPEARLKGPEKLIKIRRLISWDPAHTPILSATLEATRPSVVAILKLCRRKKNARLLLPWSLCIPRTTSPDSSPLPMPQGGGHSSWGASLLCSPLCLAKNKATLSFSSKTLSPYLISAPVYRQPRFWHHLHPAVMKTLSGSLIPVGRDE